MNECLVASVAIVLLHFFLPLVNKTTVILGPRAGGALVNVSRRN